MLLFHEVCHSSKIYLLIDGLKLENGILKEVGSNESDIFACLLAHLSRMLMGELIVYQSLRRPSTFSHIFSSETPGQIRLKFHMKTP